MNSLEQLDRAIASSVSDYALAKGWREVDCQHHSLWATRSFECGHLVFRIEYDRGLTNLAIGPIGQPSAMRWASTFRDLLEPPELGHWNIGLSGGMEFLKRHWEEINQLLSPTQWFDTVKRIDKIARQSS